MPPVAADDPRALMELAGRYAIGRDTHVGDTILGMNLSHGGHLTHGHPLNFSGKLYTIVPYGVRQDDQRIDYEELERLAPSGKKK